MLTPQARPEPLSDEAIQELCQLLDAEPDLRRHLRAKVDHETRQVVFKNPTCPNCLQSFSRYRTYQVFCSDNCRKAFHGAQKRRLRKQARQAA